MVAVIGDIHGCFFTLKELVHLIRSKFSGIEIYSVGDLVDRGAFSYEVVEFVMREEIKFTLGNHDYMFYCFMHDPTNEAAKIWIFNGFESTMKSYEKRFKKLSAHLDFISQAPLFFDLEDCFISHAGVSRKFKAKFPKDFLDDLSSIEEVVRAEINSASGILWTRDELLDLGKIQVVGHTRQSEVNFKRINRSIYLDTSAFTGNKLSAVVIDRGEVVDLLSVNTFAEDLQFF